MIHDVIIVGSGPGGAMAANILAAQQNGKSSGKARSVLLVDRQEFPRDKVCGDGLPINVMTLLNDLNIDIRQAGLEYQRIESLSITGPSGKTLTTHEPPRDIFSMTSRRFSFDHVLHQQALKTGTHFEVMNVAGPLLNAAQDRVIGVIERKGKTRIEHEARIVIAADGAGSALARGVQGRVARPETTAIAIRAYVRLKQPMPSCVYFMFKRELLPGYAWIFPLANGYANVGVYLDHYTYQARASSIDGLLQAFVAELQPDFPCEIEESTAHTWPLPLYTNAGSRTINGMLLVGDAGQFINAITGGGIYTAMLTGRAAAHQAISVLEGSTASGPTYDGMWQREVSGSLRRARLAQRHLISRSWLFNGLLALSGFPGLKSRALRILSGEHY